MFGLPLNHAVGEKGTLLLRREECSARLPRLHDGPTSAKQARIERLGATC